LGKDALEDFIVAKISCITEEDMDLAAAESALDAMLAYYRIALKSFIDNVPSLAISAKILLELPLLFRASDILRMDETLLSAIAGESEDLSERRKILHSKLKTLNEGAAICRRHKTHTHSATKRYTLPTGSTSKPSLFRTPGTHTGSQPQNSKSPLIFGATPIEMPTQTPSTGKSNGETGNGYGLFSSTSSGKVGKNGPSSNSSSGGKGSVLFGSTSFGSPVGNSSSGGKVENGGLFGGINSVKVEKDRPFGSTSSGSPVSNSSSGWQV